MFKFHIIISFITNFKNKTFKLSLWCPEIICTKLKVVRWGDLMNFKSIFIISWAWLWTDISNDTTRIRINFLNRIYKLCIAYAWNALSRELIHKVQVSCISHTSPVKIPYTTNVSQRLQISKINSTPKFRPNKLPSKWGWTS